MRGISKRTKINNAKRNGVFCGKADAWMVARNAMASAAVVLALAFLCAGGVAPFGEVAATTVENSTGLNLSVNISQVMAIRTLDATATSDISALDFAITPTPAGVRQTNTTVVDVATSNVSGYKLMMNSDYRTDGTSSDTSSAAEFTTSLINTDATIAATSVGQIATSAGSATASSTSYWNYSKSWNETLGVEGNTRSFSSASVASAINPATSEPYGNAVLENLAIPAQATPDTIRDDVDMATSSSQTSVSVNVNAATDKSSGVYKNELVFTAIANPIPVDYTLTFDKNTSDTVTNLPDPLTATVTATSYGFTIPSVSTMARSGYQFVGWSTSASSRQGSGSGPDGLYVAGDTYTVIADDSGNPDYTIHGTGSGTLYAIWALEYTYTLNYSCDASATNCPAAQTNTTTDAAWTFTIPSTAPSLDGYNFVNYTDNGAGAGNEYDPGDTVTLTSSANTKTLTANFEEAFSCVANQICYNPNGADVVGAMDNQTTVYMTSSTSAGSTDSTALSSSTTEFTLYSPNYERTGYGFVGWNTKSDGSGTMYGPNQTLLSTDTASMRSDLGSKGLIFHAIWTPSAGNLQNWSGCSSLASGQVTALTDSRDSKTYAVAKLADGKCWMIENLKYTGGGSSSNSWGTSSSYYTTKQYNYTNMNNADSTKSPTANNGTGAQWRSYGGYYSWASAINSTAAYSSGTAPAPGICPTGWRVPTSNGASTDFPALQNALNGTTSGTSTFASSNNWRKYPNNFVFSGGWYSSSANYRGTNANYWSSTANNSYNSYYLYFNSTNVNPASNLNKSYGFTVRCVAAS